MNKVAGLARALAILIAIVTAFVALPIPTAMVLMLLGAISGIGHRSDESFMPLVMLAIALPLAGGALAMVPQVGAQLQAVMTNLSGVVAGGLAARIIIKIYETLVGDIKGLTG